MRVSCFSLGDNVGAFLRMRSWSMVLLAMAACMGQARASTSWVIFTGPHLGYTEPARDLTFSLVPSNPQTPSAYTSAVKYIKQGDAAMLDLHGWDPSTGVAKIGIQAFNILTAPAFGWVGSPVATSSRQATCSFAVDTASWTNRLEAPVTATATYTVTNFGGLTSTTPGSATIKVLPNLKPVLQCAVEPVLDLFSQNGQTYVLGNHDKVARLVVDLSGSTDADGDVLIHRVDGSSYTSATERSPGSAIFDVSLAGQSYGSNHVRVSVQEPSLTVDGKIVSGVWVSEWLPPFQILKPEQAVDLLASAYGGSVQNGQLRGAFLAQLRVLRKYLAADAKPKRLPKSLRTAARNNLQLLCKLASRAPGCSPEKRAQMVDVVVQIGEVMAK